MADVRASGFGVRVLPNSTAFVVANGVALWTGAAFARTPEAVSAPSTVSVLWGLIVAMAFALFALSAVVVFQWRRLRLYRDAVEAAPDPRQLLDRRGRPLRTNKAFEAYLGTSRGAMPDLIASATSDPELAEAVRRLPQRSSQDGEARLEVPVRTEEASVWLEVQALPLGGRGAFWVAHDITRRRQMADMVQAERARFVGLLEHAPVGFFSVDQEGRFVFANATLAGWLGTTRLGLTSAGVPLHEITPAAATADVPAWSPFTSEAMPVDDGNTVHGEIELLGWHGACFRAYVSQEIVPEDGNGGFTTRSVVRNLSEERAYAEALERSERRFRRLFQEAPVGIGFLKGDGSIAECNDAFRAMLAPTVWNLTGRRLVDLVASEDRRNVETALFEHAGEAPRHAPEVRGTDGESVCTLFATEFEDIEEDTRHVVHLIDATEQKKLELQFAQSQKMQAIGQLAGGVAHDFNNLLTAMIGFCDLLLLRHRPGDQSFADLMQIKQNANRAASLVRQLLAFSRQQTLRPSVLSVTDVLAELSHLLRRLLGETIELDISHGRDLHHVKVDQGQLEQVIINLAVNGRDAMGEEGGHLSVTTQNVSVQEPIAREGETVPPGDYVLIAITDTGEGIPKGHLDRIFEPFFSTKEFGAGTGLGLSTVYGIVKQTGGFILVDSTVGAGTSFKIYLPSYRESAAEAAARQQSQPQARDLTGMGTLLLVEDEDAVRSFAARALRKKGYTVKEAASGEEALEIMDGDSLHVDVLITDVVMPTLDGPALAKQARQRQEDLKVIFISGYTEDSFRQHLDGDTEVSFLSKPFSLKQLAGAVKQVLHDEGA